MPRKSKSQADIDVQYSRIKNKAYQAYLNYEIDNYPSLIKRLNKAYDKQTANIAKHFGVASRYNLDKKQRNTKVSYSVRTGISG